MGTRLRQQKRGKGSPSYKSPGHRFAGDVRYPRAIGRGEVVEFVDDPARSSLLTKILFEDGSEKLFIAAEGLAKGDGVTVGDALKLSLGCVTALKNVPEGANVFNVEIEPGDGGRLARAAGASAQIAGRDEETGVVSVKLASKAVKKLSGNCLATLGVASGGGAKEKPFKKAGTKFFAMHAKNKYWPHVRGTAMSAYDHPHGGKSLGKPSTVSRGTPPGRKVGHVAASRTGRRRGRMKKAEGEQ